MGVGVAEGKEPDADTADSTANKTQQVSCFCPWCSQTCPKNEQARAQPLRSALTRATMTEAETKAGGGSHQPEPCWFHGATLAGTRH